MSFGLVRAVPQALKRFCATRCSTTPNKLKRHALRQHERGIHVTSAASTS